MPTPGRKLKDTFIGGGGAAVALILLAAPAVSAKDLLIFGGRDNTEYLGCLSCSEFSSDSVWNQISRYSWDRHAIGLWSEIGQYRSSVGNYSACNQFASSAPVIVDREGNFYWRLTINQFTTRSVCAFQENTQICEALKSMCDAT